MALAIGEEWGVEYYKATATGRIQTGDSCSALEQFTFKYLVLSDSDCGGGRGMFANSQN